MADSSPSSKAAEQARIRKERREAKIRAGGSARLDKITGLGGGIPRDTPPQQQQQPPAATADPEEVDISQHYYEPSRPARPRSNAPTDEQLRQMMLGYDPSTAPVPPNPFGPPSGPGEAQDPIMQMMQQMLSGAGGAEGMPSIPGMPGQSPLDATAAADSYAYIWRIVHAVFALGLGWYVAFATTFAGSRAERDLSGGVSFPSSSPAAMHFFWIFATAEVLLQSSRFFVEKGRVQQGGMLGTVMGFLPEPYRGYLALVTRYSRIWTTTSADAMVLVFVLGACAWWRGS